MRPFLGYPGQIAREISGQFIRALHLRKCIDYFFICWTLLHRPELLEDGLQNSKRRLVLLSLRIIQIIASLRCAVWMILILAPLNHHWRLVFWDQMLFADQQLNAIYLVIGAFCVYMFNRVYFYGNRKNQNRETVALVMNFLHTGDGRFRRRSKIMGVDCARARKILFSTLLAIQLFNTCLGSLNLYYLCVVLQYVGEHYSYFFGSISGLAELALLCINGVTLFLTLYLIMMEYFIQIAVGIVFTYVTFRRLRLISQSIERLRKKFNPVKFRILTRLQTHVLLDIFEANAFYGKTFLAFIVAAGPTSAYQAILILTVDLEPFIFTTCLNIVLYQAVINFGFHLNAAMYASRIHRCKGTLAHLNAQTMAGRKQRRLSVGLLVKLALCYEKFHCKRKYGMSYASFGPISFGSFFKFTLLYTECLMYCFRWIKGIH